MSKQRHYKRAIQSTVRYNDLKFQYLIKSQNTSSVFVCFGHWVVRFGSSIVQVHKGVSERQLGRQPSQSSLHSCCGETMKPLTPFLKVTKSALPQKRVCLVTSNMKVSCALLITGRVEIKVHSRSLTVD